MSFLCLSNRRSVGSGTAVPQPSYSHNACCACQRIQVTQDPSATSDVQELTSSTRDPTNAPPRLRVPQGHPNRSTPVSGKIERTFPDLELALVRAAVTCLGRLGGQPAHRIDNSRNISLSLFVTVRPAHSASTGRVRLRGHVARACHGARSVMGEYENTSGRAESCSAEMDKIAKRDQKRMNQKLSICHACHGPTQKA